MGDVLFLQLHPADNVLVVARTVEAGEQIDVGGVAVQIQVRLPLGHKIAARRIRAGESIVKYGAPIGTATRSIAIGEHVHLHNMKSNYLPTHTPGKDRNHGA